MLTVALTIFAMLDQMMYEELLLAGVREYVWCASLFLCSFIEGTQLFYIDQPPGQGRCRVGAVPHHYCTSPAHRHIIPGGPTLPYCTVELGAVRSYSYCHEILTVQVRIIESTVLYLIVMWTTSTRTSMSSRVLFIFLYSNSTSMSSRVL